MIVRGGAQKIISRGALVAVLAACLSGCASAAPVPPDPNLTCRFSGLDASVDSLRQLPPAIAAELKATAGAMADRGEFFNAGDVVSRPGPFNRFIRGGAAGGYWFVWYEHGGIAYWHQIVVLTLDPNGGAHVLASQRAAAGDLCAATERLLKGPKP